MIQPRKRSSSLNYRRLFSALAMLLLMMQQEGNRHAVEHVGEWAKPGRQQGLEISGASAAYCVECALLAGGANLIAGVVQAPPPHASDTTPVLALFSTRAAAAPSFYSSRGPPAFL